MSTTKTIDYIIEHECSVSRFGDGEFAPLIEHSGLGEYQPYSPDLEAGLREVIENRPDNLLVCVPCALNNARGMKDCSRTYWETWLLGNRRYADIANLLSTLRGNGYVFGDTQFTRPYFDWKNGRRASKVFKGIKRIFVGKRVLLIEGAYSRVGVGNDFLDGAESVERILCPPVGAFEYRDEIVSHVINVWNGQLILIALGPTATVLACDFARCGIQAIDVGHADIEYEWFQAGAMEKIPISGKYVNEAKDGHNLDDCENGLYTSQIVARIGC